MNNIKTYYSNKTKQDKLFGIKILFIILITLSLGILFGMRSYSNAFEPQPVPANTWNNNKGNYEGMPGSYGSNPTTGLFPMIYNSHRNIDTSQLDGIEKLNVTQWTVKIVGGNVCCSDSHATLRAKEYDVKFYYADPSMLDGDTYESTLDNLENKASLYTKEYIQGWENIRTGDYTSSDNENATVYLNVGSGVSVGNNFSVSSYVKEEKNRDVNNSTISTGGIVKEGTVIEKLAQMDNDSYGGNAGIVKVLVIDHHDLSHDSLDMTNFTLEAEHKASNYAKQICDEIFHELAGIDKAYWYRDNTINGIETGSIHEDINCDFGPIVGVMENISGNTHAGPGQSNAIKYEGYGYKRGYSPTHSGRGQQYDPEGTFDSSQYPEEAYIMSFVEGVYGGNGNKADRLTRFNELDMQSAWWLLVDGERRLGDGRVDEGHITDNGRTLLKQAKAFKNFLNTTGGNVTVSVDTGSAQVIVDQRNEQYLIGPLKLNFPTVPDAKDIVYCKGLEITNPATGQKLTYDENLSEFEILFASAEYSITDENGLTKKYPKPGADFYIRFYANSFGYPKDVTITGYVEYLSNAKVEYRVIDASCDYYVYVGHYIPIHNPEMLDVQNTIIEGREAHNMPFMPVFEKVTYTYKRTRRRYYYTFKKAVKDDAASAKATEDARDEAEEDAKNSEGFDDLTAEEQQSLIDEARDGVSEVVVYKWEDDKKYCDSEDTSQDYWNDDYNDTKHTVYEIGGYTGSAEGVFKNTFKDHIVVGNYPRPTSSGQYKDVYLKVEEKEVTLTASGKHCRGMLSHMWEVVNNSYAAEGGTNEKGYIITLHGYSSYHAGSFDETNLVWHTAMYVYVPYVRLNRTQYQPKGTGQILVKVWNPERTYKVVNDSKTIHLATHLSGQVWIDQKAGKNSAYDGTNSGETPASGIKVILHTYHIAAPIVAGSGISSLPVANNQNSYHGGADYGVQQDYDPSHDEDTFETTTDGNGKYRFDDLNPMYKYWVEFVYNGQYYEPTKFTRPDITNPYSISKQQWEVSSKATDDLDERDEFNYKFRNIGPNGSYKDNGELEYGYEAAIRGKTTGAQVPTQFGAGEGYLPINDNDYVYGTMIESGSQDAFGNPTGGPYSTYANYSMMSCYTTFSHKSDMDFYPYTDLFVLDSYLNSQAQVIINQLYGNREIFIVFGTGDGVTINQMDSCNLGLVERETVDVQLEKDVYSVFFEINGHLEEYRYNKRFIENPLDLNELYKITTEDRLSSNSYYSENYTREVNREDWEYHGNDYKNLIDTSGQQMTEEEWNKFYDAAVKGELRVFVKYRLAIRNLSDCIDCDIMSIVDYSDPETFLVTNANAATTLGGEKYLPYIGNGNTSDRAYYVQATPDVAAAKYYKDYNGHADLLRTYDNSDNVLLDRNATYNTNFISLFGDYQQNGENIVDGAGHNVGNYEQSHILKANTLSNTMNLFLTYEIERTYQQTLDNELHIILDESREHAYKGTDDAYCQSRAKRNYAEILGYKTYYGEYAEAPNKGVTVLGVDGTEFGIGDVAGIMDRNSIVGNFGTGDGGSDRELKSENDADRAPLFNVILNRTYKRVINGTVWEDKRTVATGENGTAKVGNGYRDSDEVGVNGVRVQLVELVEVGGKQFEIVWQEMKSGATEYGALKQVIDLNRVWDTNNQEVRDTFEIGTENNPTGYNIDDNASTIDLSFLNGEIVAERLKQEATEANAQSGLNVKATNAETKYTDGRYEFQGFAPGKYVVRFIYGSDEDTVLSSQTVNYTTGEVTDNVDTFISNKGATGYYEYEKSNSEALDKDDTVKGLINYSNIVDTSKEHNGTDLISNENENSYNGNDYKSTSYQVNLSQNKGDVDSGDAYKGVYTNVETGTYTYDYVEADAQNEAHKYTSDAKDIMSRRLEVINYSDNDVTNHKAEVLSSFENIPVYNNEKINDTSINYYKERQSELLSEFYANTYMYADTGVIDVRPEYDRNDSETSETGHNNISNGKNGELSGYFEIKNLDFGLEERPRAQLKTTEVITNVKVESPSKGVIFDASDRVSNALWNKHIAHGYTGAGVDDNYNTDIYNEYTVDKNYTNKGNQNYFMKIPVVRQVAASKGLVQLTMDKEIQQGARIQITYAITVANVGEVDYKSDGTDGEYRFYYTGIKGDHDNIVTTNAKQLISYVGYKSKEQVGDDWGDNQSTTRNNLEFNKALNDDWYIVENTEELEANNFDTKVEGIIQPDGGSYQTFDKIMDTQEAQNFLVYKNSSGQLLDDRGNVIIRNGDIWYYQDGSEYAHKVNGQYIKNLSTRFMQLYNYDKPYIVLENLTDYGYRIDYSKFSIKKNNQGQLLNAAGQVIVRNADNDYYYEGGGLYAKYDYTTGRYKDTSGNIIIGLHIDGLWIFEKELDKLSDFESGMFIQQNVDVLADYAFELDKTINRNLINDKYYNAKNFEGTGISGNYINRNRLSAIEQYNTIITTKAIDKELIPILEDGEAAGVLNRQFKEDPLQVIEHYINGKDADGNYVCNSVTGVKLVLTQTISADDDTDDQTYDSLVEIVRVNNTQGRRMNNSVVGNQDPTKEPREIDADSAEEVTIMPPFGDKRMYELIGFTLSITLFVGAIALKLFSRKNNK